MTVAFGESASLRGTLTNRPAADADQIGRLYYATDDDTLYRDTGSAWEAVGHGTLPDVDGAIAAHEAASDPHSQYLTPSELTAATVYTSALSSPPSSPTNGDLWYPSDARHVHFIRISGAWQMYVGDLRVTQPPSTGWTWVNQGSATLTNYGSLELAAVGDGSTGTRLLVRAAPSTPYTLTAAIQVFYNVDALWHHAGLFWRQSSDGKLVSFGLSSNSVYLSLKYAGPTVTDSGVYLNRIWRFVSPVIFLSLTDDGTDRKLGASLDGYTPRQMHTIGRTDYLTADQIGVGIHQEAGTHTTVLHLLSWAIT